MSRFILGLAVVASLSLLNAAPVLASGNKSGSHSSSHSSHTQHSFSHSSNTHNVQHTSFRIRQSNWGSRCWNSTYRCYTYYCPTSCCYYYYCAPYQCYYPVSYCPTGIYNYPGGN